MADELATVTAAELATLDAPSLDRSQWARGPWDDEPDFGLVQHAGFTGAVKRSWHGALCGYIVIPKGHPWYEQGIHDVRADCHGGFTFSEQMGPYWCLGFDCGHAGDLIPGMLLLSPGLFANWEYRTFDYVGEQVKGLCQQAADVTRALP